MKLRKLTIGLLLGMFVGCGECHECDDGSDCADGEYCFIKRNDQSRCLPFPGDATSCDDCCADLRECTRKGHWIKTCTEIPFDERQTPSVTVDCDAEEFE